MLSSVLAFSTRAWRQTSISACSKESPIQNASNADYESLVVFFDLLEKAGAGVVPAVEMAEANPVRVAAVHAHVDCSRFGALVITAGVFFHGSFTSICTTRR